jgi:hypothetical protein
MADEAQAEIAKMPARCFFGIAPDPAGGIELAGAGGIELAVAPVLFERVSVQNSLLTGRLGEPGTRNLPVCG